MRIFKCCMQLFMRVVICTILIFSASVARSKHLNSHSDFPGIALRDTTGLIDSISRHICNCATGTNKYQTPGDKFDSCYKIASLEYIELLQTMGIDPEDNGGMLKIIERLLPKLERDCPKYYLTLLEYWNRNAPKTQFFWGEVISQKKIGNGHFEVVMKSPTFSDTMIFISNKKIDESGGNGAPSKSIWIVEYEIQRDKKSKKYVNVLKEAKLESEDNGL